VQTAERQTVYRWGFIWSGALAATVGFVLLGVAISRSGAWGETASALGLSLMGWGSLLQAFNALSLTPIQLALKQPLVIGGTQFLGAGALVWLAGWGLMAAGIRRAPAATEGPSPAAGAPLYPRLAGYRDFYWSTLGAYGGGVLLAEMVLILLQTLLSSGVQTEQAG
jgi:lipoprotein-releasing system permease protein